jgi:hypothetical protein
MTSTSPFLFTIQKTLLKGIFFNYLTSSMGKKSDNTKKPSKALLKENLINWTKHSFAYAINAKSSLRGMF